MVLLKGKLTNEPRVEREAKQTILYVPCSKQTKRDSSIVQGTGSPTTEEVASCNGFSSSVGNHIILRYAETWRNTTAMLCISGCPQVGTKLPTPMLPFFRKHHGLELSEALKIVLLFKSIHISLHPFRSIYIISTTLWLFNIAMVQMAHLQMIFPARNLHV